MIRSYRPYYLGILVLSFLAVTLPWWVPVFTVQLTIRGMYLGIVAMSFILLAGYGDMTSMAQMSFTAMSGYVIGIGVMRYGMSHGLLALLGILGATGLSAIFGLVAIRAQKIYFLIMTMALSLMFYGVGMQWASVTGGSDGITGITRPTVFGYSLIQYRPMYYLTLIVTVVCYIVLDRLIRSPFGIALQGIRDNPRRMTSLGFNVQLHRYLAFVISGTFAGIAGVLTVYFTGVILPDRAALGQTILVVLASLVGGVFTLKGGLLGGLLMAYLISLTSQYTSRYWAVLGALFIVVVIYMPNGLLGGDLPLEAWLKRLRSKIIPTAGRDPIHVTSAGAQDDQKQTHAD